MYIALSFIAFAAVSYLAEFDSTVHMLLIGAVISLLYEALEWWENRKSRHSDHHDS
jgi:hypothetical protein